LTQASAFATNQDQDLIRQSDRLNTRLRELQNGPLGGIGTLLTQNLGRPARQAALDVDGAAIAADRFKTSLDGLNAKLQQSQNQIALRSSIRDLGTVVKNNPLGTSLDTGLGKAGLQGDAVRTQLLSIIQLTLQVASGLNAVDQGKFLRSKRAEILQVATDLGVPLKAVQALLTSFGIVDRTKVAPKVDNQEFDKGLTHAKTSLEKFLNGDYQVKIKTALTGTKALNHLLLGPITPADGTTVPGPRFPYGDRVPALLSPGEEVISNRHGQADRHRELLKQINSNRMAYGSTVQRAPGNSSYATAPDIDYDRLATAMSAVRPMYGDVHVSGDPTAFRQTLENDKRMSSLDGVRR